MQIQIPYIRIKLNQIPTLAIPISQYIYFRNTYAKQNPKYSRIDIRVSKIKDKSSDAMIIINIQKNEKNIAMSTGWNSHRENHQGINFDELFADPTFNAIKLIAIPNIVNQCKTQQDSITDKLISKPDILDDLLTICLRPEHIKNTEFGPITTQHTFRALEIINSLEIQRFSQYLLGMKKKQQVEDDVVVTQDILESKQEIVGEEVPLFTKVLINLKQQKPLQETPLGYMCKIATNICSQKPKQVLKLLKQNKNEIINLIFQHFYSNSTLQFFIRVLEMEDSNSFYQPEKVAIFQHFAHALGKNDDVLEIRIEILENYATLLNFLFEKTDDRFDKAKFISLCKQIFPYKFPIQQILTRAKFLITTSLTSSSIQQLPYIFLILEKYLHFHNNFKPGLLNNINNSISHNSNNRSQGNIGNSMGQGNNGLDASVVMDIILDSQIVAGVRDFSFQISKIITGTTNKQEIKQENVPLTFLLPYFKLVRSLLIILDPQQEIYIQTLITSQLIRYLLRLIDVHRSSTILHNTFKDIMIQCLVKNYDYIVPLLFDSKNCNFLSLASEMRSKGNSKQFQYENQIYHIIQITIKRGEDSSNVKCLDEIKKNCPQFQELISKIKEKEKLYSTLIGGDPRKQSSYWGQDSQEDRIFTTTQKMTNSGKKITQEVLSPNANDLIEGNIQHWFDCGGLPLDSDESKDEQDGQQEKKQEAGNPNSPVYINVLGDFQRQEQKEKQREKQKQKQSNNRQAQSELSKKLKNIGIKQCEQQQIRIPIKKQRYENTKSNRKKSKESIQMQLKIERPNEIKKVEQKQIIIEKKQSIDKVEEQLEDQIRKLEDKRLHHQQVQNQEPQIQQRVQKKVDSIQQSQIAPIQTNPSKQPIIISSLMDLSSDKDKSLQNQSLQQQNNTVSEEKVKIQLKPDVLDSKQLQKVEQQPRSDEKNKEEQSRSGTSSPQKYKKVSQNNYFPTYLSFQIDQILAELDQYLPWSRQPKSL